jgi:hypothetical protein
MNGTSKIGYCLCKLGYTGKFCETKITCPPNQYGDDCSVQCYAIDTCEIHQVCDYYGRLRCKDGWGSFPECNTRLINPSIDPECPLAKSIPVSNTSILLTSPVACLNGGSCWANKCCCPPTFTGPRCEIFINYCASNPCKNGGSCQTNQYGFTCQCKDGFSGVFCQTRLDPCKNSMQMCSQRGLCITLKDLTGYTCSCFESYTGRYCEKKIDHCSSMPCLNSGSCVSHLNGYFCSCPFGYTGQNCETMINFCSSSPCIHGICYPLVNDYICKVSFIYFYQ